MLIGKIKVVLNYVCSCFAGMLSQEFDVVNSLRIHGLFAVACFNDTRFAKDSSLPGHAFNIFCPPDVIDKLRHQVGYIGHGDHSVFIENSSKVLDRLAQHPVCYLVHVVGDGLCSIIRFRHLHHAHHGKRAENGRNKVCTCAQWGLGLNLIKSVIIVPVSRGLNIVFCRNLVYKVLDHGGLGEWPAVDGNKTDSASFKALI